MTTAQIRARHVRCHEGDSDCLVYPGGRRCKGKCQRCLRMWPCDAITLCERVEKVEVFFLSWILRAYESRKREGWETGMTQDELDHALLDILFNYESDPGLSQHKEKVAILRKMEPVRSVEMG